VKWWREEVTRAKRNCRDRDAERTKGRDKDGWNWKNEI